MFFEQPKKERKLMNEDLMVLAKQPTNNPESLEILDSYPRYALTPIQHDYPGKTPTIWNSVYKTLKVDSIMAMVVSDIEDVEQVTKTLREDPKYIGGGVGVGFKDKIIHFLDELDPLAQAIGSVNVIKKMPNGNLRGYNTDGIGYLESLIPLVKKEDGKEISNVKMAMLGAGGTGNSIVFALAEVVGEIIILNRSIEKAKNLADRVNKYTGKNNCRASGEDSIQEEVLDADVIINVSTKGSAGELEEYSSLAVANLPVNTESIEQNKKETEKTFGLINKDTIISDIILRNGDTPLITLAKKFGFKTLDGLPMVINQGVESFWLLHGEEMEKRGIKKEEVAKIIIDATK
ncbi:MAG: hypothetical protein PHN69_04775 [Candidatus Pacebacteria bacterium]|nr:hypothetical protein [Candidatus Paceibacterota bacterium]